MAPQDIAWPHWMRRFSALASEEAFNDLIWSVGGSPPYGGVSWEEAEAVYKLLKAYRGPGQADPAVYEALDDHIKDSPEKVLTLRVFQVHDRIASAPQAFTSADVDEGAALAVQLGDEGLRAYFELLDAQLRHQEGDIRSALLALNNALARIVPLAKADSAFASLLGKVVVNGTSYHAISGDLQTARQFADLAIKLGFEATLAPLLPALRADRPAGDSAQVAERHAGDLLEAGRTLEALEWFRHAEALASARNDRALLCGLLGDMAVAYRRLGNQRASLETYARAIELCRIQKDDVNLSRWCGNLGSLLLNLGDVREARVLLEEASVAAHRTGESDRIAIAEGNLAAMLQHDGRHQEAFERMASARLGAEGPTREAWRERELQMHLNAAIAGSKRHDHEVALEHIAAGLEAVRADDDDDQRIAVALLLERAKIEEEQNDLMSAAASLNAAAERFDRLGDKAAATDLRAAADRLDL
ncbi:tetratricopeptide repeat protein [Variovorax saccharolyticus]|uniref:tetratricopeptide repeat protein n=1 Tax=Variovorax saccharolyticus TaxID=3053516 RepID=UPI0025757DC9|nr:tetratricopeptide repeat protein [Variovorax sp. J22R187]MDM0022163.1 tetratricopeptide repeat protein [Variovorax sp. J22R187]